MRLADANGDQRVEGVLPKVRFAIGVGGVDGVRNARLAEELGYDGIWAGDHVMNGRPMADCLTSLAAAAALTTGVDIISGVLLLPLRHPVPVAKALTTIDHISQGRLTVGVGVGGEYPQEWEASGVPVRERGRRMDEGLQVLRKAWTEDTFSFDGRFYPLHDVTLLPKPYRKPHPPIWVGGRKEPSQRRTARFATGWLPYLVTPQDYETGLKNIERFAKEYETGPLAAGFTRAILVFIGLTDIGDYDPSRDPTGPMRKRGDKYYLIGDTRSCVERLRQFVDVGVEYFTIAWVCEPRLVERHMRHFIESVAPQFR